MERPQGALDAAIARVRDQAGQIVGVGFLVGPRELLTCAHVVERALGHLDGEAPAQSRVTVDFPLVAPDEQCSAEVVWHQEQPNGSGDVAGLRLVTDPPAGARPVRLVIAPEVWNHPFRAFGFPHGHDGGVWASGRLLGRQSAGWVQLDDDRTSGFAVGRGFSGTPVWDSKLDGVVGMAVAAEARPSARTAYLIPSGTIVELWPELGSRALLPCPYKGLAAFQEQDEDLFCGREELAAQLADMAGSLPLVAVVGPSGSGKSSLVFAGALPRLRQQPGLAIVSCRPAAGASPLDALAGALLPLLEPGMSESDQLGELPKLAAVLGEGRLGEVAGRVLAKTDSTHLLLVVDQFEELFVQGPDVAEAFIDVLLGALGDGRPCRVRVLLTLRADFFGQALDHSGLAERLREAVLPIGRMTRAQLERVIEEPAAGAAAYEAGLVERILDDVGAEPGNLALLEFALTLLWDRQDRGVLTRAAYDELGGVPGALAGYAERVYLGLSEPERETARRVFTQLVRPGEAAGPTKRIARRADFDDAQWAVAQSLAATRLIVTDRAPGGEETVELAHEALIGGWDRLRDWVEADRAFRGWQEQLRLALARWESSGRDRRALLSGLPLAEAQQWRKDRPADLPKHEHTFIHASHTRNRRALHRLQALTASVTILLLIVTALSLEQRQQNRITTSRLLTEQARNRTDLSTSILLHLAAFQTSDTPETQGSLLDQYLRYRNVDALLSGHPSFVSQFAVSGDGQTLASLDEAGNALLWDLTQARSQGVPLGSPTDGIRVLALSPDGRTLATDSSTGTITFWDVATRAPRGPTVQAGASLEQLAFSPDGQTLASVSAPGDEVAFWDVATRTQQPPPSAAVNNGEPMGRVWYGPNSQTLITAPVSPTLGSTLSAIADAALAGAIVGAIAGGAGLLASAAVSETMPGPNSAPAPEREPEVVIWDLATGDRTVLATVSGPVAISPNGGRVAILDSEAEAIRIWDLTAPEFPESQINVSPFDSGDMKFDSRGERLAINDFDSGRVLVWDAVHGQQLGIFPTNGEGGQIEFGPDNRTLVTATRNNIALLKFRPVDLRDDLSSFRGEVSPDRSNIATVDPDGGVSIRNAVNGARIAGPARLPSSYEEARPASPIDYSPSGATLVTAVEDQPAVYLWDTTNGIRFDAKVDITEVSTEGPLDAPYGDEPFALLSDEVLLTNIAGRVSVWNVDTRQRVRTLPTDGNVTLFSAPDRGSYIATVRRDSTEVELWNVETGERIEPLAGSHATAVTAIGFSSDGRRLASGDADGVIILWDVKRRTPLYSLYGGGSIEGLAFTSDSRRLISTSDMTILWDLDRGDRLLVTEADVHGPLSATRDGRALAVTINGSVEFVDLDPAAWIRHLCGVVGRDLSENERRSVGLEGSSSPVCAQTS